MFKRKLSFCFMCDPNLVAIKPAKRQMPFEHTATLDSEIDKTHNIFKYKYVCFTYDCSRQLIFVCMFNWFYKCMKLFIKPNQEADLPIEQYVISGVVAIEQLEQPNVLKKIHGFER